MREPAKHARRRVICFLLMLSIGGAALAADLGRDTLVTNLQSTIEQLPRHPLYGRELANEQAGVNNVYRTGSLLWSNHGQLSAQARALIELGRAASALGLRSEDYGTGQLSNSAALLSDPALLDVWLTISAARLLSHLHYGRVDPRLAGFELSAVRNDLDIASAVILFASTPDVASFLAQVEPQFYHYALLKRALDRYRQLALDPSLTQLPVLGKQALHQGDIYAGSPALRRLLVAEGDLPASASTLPASGLAIDASLSEALKAYQARHGLAVDGNLTPSTWRALTTPLSARVRQIELTLERWRWLPPFSTPPIVVNIPQFELFAFNTTADRAASILQMPVIVGHNYPGKRTPVFVADLKDVIFRPYWDVPRSITVHEMLPEIHRHADYLERNHLELVQGESENGTIVPPSPTALAQLAAGQLRLRQQPGIDNALGLVKFVFPNSHQVYMHSTPAHNLFLATRRAFSHGCIRVSDPVALAEFVLRNSSRPWSRTQIESAMQDGTNMHVNVVKPIRVMILYGTAMATEAGPVQFFDDIYGHDRELAALLGL